MWWDDLSLCDALRSGKLAVMPTDTIYGIVGSAFDEATVNRIYQVRQRAPAKPCIILIGDLVELEKFSIKLSKEEKNKLKEYWLAPSGVEGSGPASVILDCLDDKLSYLHRGTKSLAFRIPQDAEFRNFLIKTGPLIAPSANPESQPPAKNITEAKNYFGDSVDLYIDAGEIAGRSSRIVKLRKDGGADIIRE